RDCRCDPDDVQRGRHFRRHRLGRPCDAACRADAGGSELRSPPSCSDAARWRLSAPRRHACADHGSGRDADRHSHGDTRRAVLHLAARARPIRMDMTLEASRLDIGYPGYPVAGGIDVSVAGGEVLCLLGPNGSGKTTLFKTLLGLLPARGGEVRLDGRVLSSLSRSEVARRIAYVPQAHTAHFPYRVLDMVLMGRTAHLGLFATPGQQDRRRAAEALDALGIAELANAEYTRISGGQRQLALIARALAQDAPI